MTEPALDVARQRRRLAISMGVTVACAIAAMAAVVLGFVTHNFAWMTLVAVAIAVGVAAQVWLIIGVLRAK